MPSPPEKTNITLDVGVRCLWLFGRPRLIHSMGIELLHLKYRRGVAVLGFLIGHANRPVRRVTVAGLLWPELESSAARANLRVVLSDLSAELKRLGIPDSLQADRDLLTFRTTPGLLTDDEFLKQSTLAPASLREHIAAILSDDVWLEGSEESTGEDFFDWLIPHREYMRLSLGEVTKFDHAAQGEQNAYGDTAPSSESTSAPHIADAPRIAVVTWLRVEVAVMGTSDTRIHRPAVNGLLHALCNEAEYFNGVMLDSDDAGATFLFGTKSPHPGQRWLALRAAAAMHAKVGSNRVLRMGATSGRAVVEIGPPLHVAGWRKRLADRLAMAAEDGHILCDDSFADLANSLHCTALPARRFRGFDREFLLYDRPLSDSAPMRLPPRGDVAGDFFAREDLLHVFDELFIAGVQAGHGHVAICVTGESGLGKTRFVWEFAHRRQLKGQPIFWLSAVPEARDVPLRSLYDLLSSLLHGGGSVDEMLDHAFSAASCVLSHESRHAISGFITSHQLPQSMRAPLVDALAALLTGDGTHRVLVVVDDAPWLDSATVEILNRLMQQGGLKVDWLLTSRPSETNLVEVPNVTAIELLPLGDAMAETILRRLSGSQTLTPQELCKRIANARGLPLYLLADSSAAENSNHFDEFCQAMMTRLGRCRPTLEMAAVLGMLFDTGDLAALADAERTSEACEKGLASGLLVARSTRQLSFFHPQLREYLLASTPPVLIEQYAQKAAQLLGNRKRHAEAALLWQLGGATDQARAAWRSAAFQAMKVEDYSSASDSWAHLTLLDDTSTSEGIAARIAQARCLIARDGYGSAEAHRIALQAYSAALEIDGLDGNTVFAALALAYLGSSSQGHLEGIDYAQRMLDTAVTSPQLYTAFWAMGNTLFWLGEFGQARAWLTQNIELGLELSLRERMTYFPSDLAVFARAEMAWLLWFVGEPDASGRMQEEAARFARTSTTRQDQCIASCFAGLVAWCAGDLDALAQEAEAASATALREGFGFWCCVSELLLALVHAGNGEHVDLQELVRSSAGLLDGYRAAEGTAQWLVTGALLASGQTDSALAVISQALATSSETEHRQCGMDLWRMKSEALGRKGLAVESSAALEVAENLARKAGAHGWLRRWEMAEST